MKGEDITDLPTTEIVSKGLPRSGGPPGFSQPNSLENLKIGAYLRDDKDGIQEDIQHVYELFPGWKSGPGSWRGPSQAVSSRCWQLGVPSCPGPKS